MRELDAGRQSKHGGVGSREGAIFRREYVFLDELQKF